jgi:hypothetical protein
MCPVLHLGHDIFNSLIDFVNLHLGKLGQAINLPNRLIFIINVVPQLGQTSLVVSLPVKSIFSIFSYFSSKVFSKGK